MAERNYLKTEAVFLTEKTPKKEVVVTPPLREDSLTVTENGTYQAPIGRGYTDVEVNVQELPEVTSEDNGKVLKVEDGEWEAGGTASWETTVTMGFTVGTDTATIGGTTFVKTSDKYFTDEQLVGATFHMGVDSITITQEMLVDMSTYGVDATGINLPTFGMVVFCAHTADSTIPSAGTYLVQAMASYAPAVTLSYTDTIAAQTLPIAIGTAEYESGVTDMPSGVVYFQLED